MTEHQENMRFKHHFWFAVGLCSIAVVISFYILVFTTGHVDMVLTFWLTSAASTGINFSLGNSSSKSKVEDVKSGSTEAGSVSLNLQANTSTEPVVEHKPPGE